MLVVSSLTSAEDLDIAAAFGGRAFVRFAESIDVRSYEGKGSTFSVVLPAAMDALGTPTPVTKLGPAEGASRLTPASGAARLGD